MEGKDSFQYKQKGCVIPRGKVTSQGKDSLVGEEAGVRGDSGERRG